MTRKLLLSGRRPYNSSFSTPEGQVLYKTSSPWKIAGRTATVYKVVPDPADSTDMRDSFEEIAEIKYHTITSSRITYNGESQSTSSFFRRGGLGWLGSDRIFTGPDGKEYRWVLANTKPVTLYKLYTNEKPRERVAKFNQASLISLDPDKSSANLEIYPAGEHMVDMIVVTLCYVEKLRLDRERSAASGGGG